VHRDLLREKTCAAAATGTEIAALDAGKRR